MNDDDIVDDDDLDLDDEDPDDLLELLEDIWTTDEGGE